MPRLYVHKAASVKNATLHINKEIPLGTNRGELAKQDAKIIRDMLYRHITGTTYNELYLLLKADAGR